MYTNNIVSNVFLKDNATPGLWILRSSSTALWNVKVEGYGDINFEYKLMKSSDGILFDIFPDSPLPGKCTIF